MSNKRTVKIDRAKGEVAPGSPESRGFPPDDAPYGNKMIVSEPRRDVRESPPAPAHQPAPPTPNREVRPT
jgi:hypothetical protein